MAARTDTFDLASLRLSSGEGRRLDVAVLVDSFEMGGHTYAVTAAQSEPPEGSPAATGPQGASRLPAEPSQPSPEIPVTLDISRLTGQGYALALGFGAALHGPCMRCLEPADPEFKVGAREVSQPGEGEDLESPYVSESLLDLGAWARDSLALVLPSALLCRPHCAGLCPVCGADLNRVGPEHHHEAEPDPRWAVLSEVSFDGLDGSSGPSGAPAEGR